MVSDMRKGEKNIANSKYSARHNRALMTLAVIWAKGNELFGHETVWYNERLQ